MAPCPLCVVKSSSSSLGTSAILVWFSLERRSDWMKLADMWPMLAGGELPLLASDGVLVLALSFVCSFGVVVCSAVLSSVWEVDNTIREKF